MLQLLPQYLWECLVRAWRGSLSSALNWAGIIGVGAVGAYLESRGQKMSDPHAWQEIVKWGAAYTAVAWVIIFAIRAIFVAKRLVGTPSNDAGCLIDFCRNIECDSVSSISDEREISRRGWVSPDRIRFRRIYVLLSALPGMSGFLGGFRYHGRGRGGAWSPWTGAIRRRSTQRSSVLF